MFASAAVGEELDVDVSALRDGQRTQVADTDADSRAVGSREGEYGPPDCLSGCLAGVAYPSAGGNVYADPPEEMCQHANHSCNFQV